MFKVKIVTVNHFCGDYAGEFGNVLNHCEDRAAVDAATFGFLFAAKHHTIEGTSLLEVAERMIRDGYAGQQHTIGCRAFPSRFKVAEAAERWSYLSTYIEAYDNKKFVWVNLAALSPADREALVAILNRIELDGGDGILADEDYAALEAEREAAAKDPGDPERGCDGRGNFEPRTTPRSMDEVLKSLMEAGDIPAFQRGLPLELD